LSHPRNLLLALGLLCAASYAGEQAPIALTNYEDGATIRYPVPIIRGTLADAAATEVTVVNSSSKRDTREMKGLVHKGRFIVLAELVAGENKLVIRSGKHKLPLTLHYKPQTNPYLVRVVYVSDKDGHTDYQTPLKDDRQDWRGKLDTAMKLLQSFTAESLNDGGFGRRTFNLELDESGKVKVHLLQGDRSMAEYHKLNGMQLYGHIGGMIHRKLRRPKTSYLAIPAFTRLDPETGKLYCHTALGGGNLALFGGGDLFAWPDTLAEVQPAFLNPTRVDPKKIFSDSVGRHTFWAIASTTIGAALHELGHTFGLPHTNHPHDIMTRGIDRLNRFVTFVEPPHARRGKPYEFKQNEIACWPAISAAALAHCRHFALDDREWIDTNTTEVSLDTEHAEIVVRSGNGVRYIGAFRNGATRQFTCPAAADKPAPKEARISAAELGKRIRSGAFTLRILDGQGLWKGADMAALLAGPSVRAWRFATITQPWRDKKAFPPVDEARLKEIVASAKGQGLVTSPDSFVDFLPRFPNSKRAHAAGYVVRTIKVDEPRNVKILTGSDDALRLWLNGRLVQKVLELRGAAADAESVTVELRKGENTLVAEVSNGIGGWGLYLRVEDDKGAPLELSDAGKLASVAKSPKEKIRALLRGSSGLGARPTRDPLATG